RRHGDPASGVSPLRPSEFSLFPFVSARRAVADGGVAADAVVARLARGAELDDVVREGLVASDAVGLQDVGVARRDADRLVEVLQGEALGVPEAVARLV